MSASSQPNVSFNHLFSLEFGDHVTTNINVYYDRNSGKCLMRIKHFDQFSKPKFKEIKNVTPKGLVQWLRDKEKEELLRPGCADEVENNFHQRGLIH